MARYELTNNQVKSLRALIANANIKGMDAPIILELQQALLRPIIEKQEGKHESVK